MGISSEVLVVKLRFGPEHLVYGDDFSGVVDLANMQDGGCLIAGLLSLDKFTVKARNLILAEALKWGWTFACAKIGEVWFRYDTKTKRRTVIKL